MREEGLQYYLPLTPGQDGVLSPTVSAELRGSDLPLVSDLAEYIERHYTVERGVADISGRRYEGEVLKPIGAHDHWYIVVDDMGLPCSARTCDRELLGNELATLDAFASSIWFSEAMSPQESISVHDSFVEPVFSEVSKTSKEEKLSWNSLLDFPRIVILGGPGAGKTTTLRRMACMYLERWRHDNAQLYPIYVQMRSIQFGSGVERIVRASLGMNNEADQNAGNCLEIFDQRVVLILDGIDEVPDSIRDEVVSSIHKFSSRYASISIVVSTRESGFNWKLPSFRHVRIRPFTSSNIREWSFFRFGPSARHEWANFVTSLEERDSVKELAGNPLFLSLAVSLFRRSSTFPQSKAALLKSYITAMTEGWDSVRGVVRQREPWAAPHRKTYVLCSAAYRTRVRSQDHFTYPDFTAWCEAIGEEPSLLFSCERDTGLVRKVSSDKWGFSHRVFADFLAAQFIVEHTGNALDHLGPLFKSGNWLDIWAFACGMSHNASELVQFVLDAKNIKREKKVDALAAAFEQDIAVSKDVLKKSASFIEKQVRKLLGFVRLPKNKGLRESRKHEFHLPTDSSRHEIERARLVILSVRRLRKSRMGEELACRLRDVDEEVICALVELLETDSLALIAEGDSSEKTIVLQFEDDVLGLSE